MSEFKCLPDADREFHLRCRIKTARSAFKNAGNVQHENTMVFLIPSKSLERDEFFAKYLPRTENKDGQVVWTEMTAYIADPVSRIARIALCRATQFYLDGPYIHVMDLDAAKALEHKEGARLEIRVVSENEDARKARNAHR
jgi:hypothetical protein